MFKSIMKRLGYLCAKRKRSFLLLIFATYTTPIMRKRKEANIRTPNCKTWTAMRASEGTHTKLSFFFASFTISFMQKYLIKENKMKQLIMTFTTKRTIFAEEYEKLYNLEHKLKVLYEDNETVEYATNIFGDKLYDYYQNGKFITTSWFEHDYYRVVTINAIWDDGTWEPLYEFSSDMDDSSLILKIYKFPSKKQSKKYSTRDAVISKLRDKYVEGEFATLTILAK